MAKCVLGKRVTVWSAKPGVGIGHLIFLVACHLVASTPYGDTRTVVAVVINSEYRVTFNAT